MRENFSLSKLTFKNRCEREVGEGRGEGNGGKDNGNSTVQPCRKGNDRTMFQNRDDVTQNKITQLVFKKTINKFTIQLNAN